MSLPKLGGIDHFHLYVDDITTAANWYQEILGFKVVESLLLWNDKGGPLTIEDESATIHLALFARDNQPPSTSIAFKATGKDFLLWKAHLTDNGLDLRVSDHQVTWSMYFRDPFNNMHEITTHDHQFVADNIG